MSRFCLLALGSRGDVEPFVALARELARRGHETVIAAAEDYGPLVREAGIPFAPLVGRIAELMDFAAVNASLDGGPLGSLQLARQLRQGAAPLLSCLLRDAIAAARNCDVLVASTLGQYVAPTVSDVLNGVPTAFAHFHPVAPSRFYADMFIPPSPFRGKAGEGYNRATHALGTRALWYLLLSALNRARRELDLPALSLAAAGAVLRRQQAGLHLHAYSPLWVPPFPDWNPLRHFVTGYWRENNENQPLPAELAAFLDRGEPPVYIGFGSILAGRDPDRMTRLFIDALNAVQMRGVLFAGWGDVGNIGLPSSIFLTRGAPHDALFPRCAVVVHHGGAGTTAAALYAGVPAVCVPVFGDQFFWAERLHASGASPALIPRRALTANRLAQAIRDALDNPEYRRQTQRLQAALQTENGAARAADVLESWQGNLL